MIATKRLLKRPWVQGLLACLAAAYLRAIYNTTRWTVISPPATHDLIVRHEPAIACFWHGRMMLMRAAVSPKRKVHILISGHRDGLLISRAIARLGAVAIEGSSRRGGASALRAIQRLLAQRALVAITPDGPRGPRMRAKAGAIKAAQLSGAPILPVSGAISRRRILASWDRFCLGLPFSEGVIMWGEPIEVPRDADHETVEALRLALETTLNDLTAQADSHFGQAVVEPDDRRLGRGRANHARA